MVWFLVAEGDAYIASDFDNEAAWVYVVAAAFAGFAAALGVTDVGGAHLFAAKQRFKLGGELVATARENANSFHFGDIFTPF